MNEWEVKYRALLMGISDQASIDAAEKMAAVCVHMATTMPYTLEECYWMMARLVGTQMPLPFETARQDELRSSVSTLRTALKIAIETFDDNAPGPGMTERQALLEMKQALGS